MGCDKSRSWTTVLLFLMRSIPRKSDFIKTYESLIKELVVYLSGQSTRGRAAKTGKMSDKPVRCIYDLLQQR